MRQVRGEMTVAAGLVLLLSLPTLTFAQGGRPRGGGPVGHPVDAWPYYPEPYPSSPDGYPPNQGSLPYPGPYPDAQPRRPSGPPPPSADEIAARTPAWFHCDSPNGFYPYVKTCAANWTPTPISLPPPGTALPPAIPGLAHCDSPAGYFPYVAVCKGGWTSETARRPEGVPGGPRAVWSYCAAEAGFAPYVHACQAGWREIAAPPPPEPDPRTPLGPTASR